MRDDYDAHGYEDRNGPACAYCGARLGLRYGAGAKECWNCKHRGAAEAQRDADAPDPRIGAEDYYGFRYPPLGGVNAGHDGLALSEVRGETPRLPVHGVRQTTPEGAIESESQTMPNMDDVYGGNTLKAEDVPQDYRGTLVVESVMVQSFDNEKKGTAEKKIVLRFKGAEKGLALNITNANMMAEIAGTRDYDYWPGKRIVLYRTMTDYAGKRVPALRLDHPTPTPKQPPTPPPPPAADPARDDTGFQVSDSEVPF